MILGGEIVALLLATGAPRLALKPSTPLIPPVPIVVFKGLSLKGVQFSRTDRVPESLVAAIDKTDKTLLLALYDLRLPEVADAIVRAKRRGVNVRMVYDESHVTASGSALVSGPSAEFLRVLEAGVPTRLLRGGGSFGIMHNKFAIFDGELLVTGSFNWTRAADVKNFENAIFRSDPALADGFAEGWNWMWSLGRGVPPAVSESGFGVPPADATRPISFNGGWWPRYAFSPRGAVEDMLVDAFGRARSTIDVAIFSFYSQRVADALIAARARGVIVRVAADLSQSRRSQPLRALADAGVGLRLSAGRGGAGVNHHKYALVDGAWLMTGSYNFSQNAELYSFENVLFTVTPGEVAAYGGEFAAVWDGARAPISGDLPPPKSP